MKSDQSKPARKLTVNKETLRRLATDQLREAGGGGTAPLAGDETVGDTCRTREWSSCPPCD